VDFALRFADSEVQPLGSCPWLVLRQDVGYTSVAVQGSVQPCVGRAEACVQLPVLLGKMSEGWSMREE